MTLRDRIKYFCANQFITVAEFERKSGLSNGYVRQLKSRIGNEKLRSISEAFPNLSLEWLVLEHGNMIVPPSSSNEKMGNLLHTISYNNIDNNNDSSNNFQPIIDNQYLEQLEWFKRELDKRDSQFDRLLTLFERITNQHFTYTNLDDKTMTETRQK